MRCEPRVLDGEVAVWRAYEQFDPSLVDAGPREEVSGLLSDLSDHTLLAGGLPR